MSETAPLQIDCTITRIATVAAGGWSLTVHIPEIFAPQVKPLIGHENKTQFVLMLVEAGKIEGERKEGIPEWAQKKKHKS